MPGTTAHEASFAELLSRHLTGLIEFTGQQIGALQSHYETLERWNKVLNLTSIRDREQSVIRHYCESLFLGQVMALSGFRGRVLDFGSGAGFPGFPIAVLYPEWEVTLLDSHQRKAVFLREASRVTPNATVLNQRAEDVEGRWDAVVSRAVRPAEVLEIGAGLAPQVGLLVGDEFIAERSKHPEVIWKEPARLPWGGDRWALTGLFHVERWPPAKCSTWNHLVHISRHPTPPPRDILQFSETS